MKKITSLLLAACYSVNASSQTIPGFKSLRYDEDYAFLQNDSVSTWYNKTKYSTLSKNGHTYISFGGDIRLQYFNIKNEGWGEEPKDKEGFVFARYLVHGDFHAGKYFRTFVQLQSSLANGKAETSPVDENPLEIHQAFIDINTNTGHYHKLIFRLGRQEFSYGSQRLVAVREGPNNRQSFDAVKAMFVTANYKADLFYSHYVAAHKELFDDGFNKNTRFWGGYLVKNNIPVVKNIDLYYLGLWKRNAHFDEGQTKEIRHSIGSRIWGNKNSWKYDAEALYQFGSFGSRSIAAWTTSMNTAYEFDRMKYQPEIGLKAELISGDKDYNDEKLQTFNPLFPRGGYFGLASVIGPANLIDVHPSVSFTLSKSVNWNIDFDAFWRYSRNDGIYAPSVSMIYSGKNIKEKYIGQQLSTDVVFTPNAYVYFRTEFTWFKTGAYLKKAGPGKDILFAGITTQIKF